jgi:hypothetical protein
MRKKRAIAKALPESREELLAHLEQLTGQMFHTHEDVRKFVVAIEAEKARKQARAASGWRALKSTTLFVLLILAFVQYYLADSLLQMASLRELTFFVPVMHDVRSALVISGLG